MNSVHATVKPTTICQSLHQMLKELPIHRFPYNESLIPKNGIYVLFEDGEVAHGANRIVRIGTHTGANQLRSRLKQHFLIAKKDRSIFRKNIGRCLLNQDKDPFLQFWELDLTSHAAKVEWADKIDTQKQIDVETMVSDYIQGHLQFVAFQVSEKNKRLELESKIISTVSHCHQCKPSPQWLGHHSPKIKIRLSGLWQVNELNKTPLTDNDLDELRHSLVM